MNRNQEFALWRGKHFGSEFWGAARFLLIALTAGLATFLRAEGATITSLAATWPTTPAVQSVDGLSVTHANRGVALARVNRQSLTVTQPVKMTDVFLSANAYNNLPFLLQFFEVSDVNAANLSTALGAQVGPTITVDAFGSTATGDRNLQIALSGAEQILLPAAASPAGYVATISLVDPLSATAAFNWVHSNTGADVYAAGRYRRDDGDQTATRDFGIALQSIPEPASAILLALAFAPLGAARRTRGKVVRPDA